MEILSINHPNIKLRLSNGEVQVFDFEAYLDKTVPEANNPYRAILEQQMFDKAYTKDGRLIWDGVLELQMCGGDTMWMPAEFTEREVLENSNK
ncbi:hypothetical protein [uncultured Arcticibacterium sp.]|uniref:hypothetical protein n=1 Tax=uncultured Arcticibacterium sp. TaxID=2173042 RepID=UPI0030F922A0